MLVSEIFVYENKNIKIREKVLHNVSDFIDKPLFSLAIKVIDIHKALNISAFYYKDIKAKCLILPYNNKFAIIPILHN